MGAAVPIGPALTNHSSTPWTPLPIYHRTRSSPSAHRPTVGVARVDGKAIAAGVGGVDVLDVNLAGFTGRVGDSAGDGEEDFGARFVLVQVDHLVG